MPELLLSAAAEGQRFVDVGWAVLGTVARRAIGPLIAAGDLTLDGQHAVIAQVVHAGQRLGLSNAILRRLSTERLLTPPSEVAVPIVHADDDLLILDKPPGMHVHPVGVHRQDTLLGCALAMAGARENLPWTRHRPAPAHRLDRPTSGLVLFTRSVRARGVVQGMFERHEVGRTYHAQVEGRVSGNEGVIDEPLAPDPVDTRRPVRVEAGGRPARSHWQVLRRETDTTTLRLRIETGRTHQLRAHLAHVGHPIVGDLLYGAAQVGPAVDPSVGGVIALRGVSLSLLHPRTNAPMQFDGGFDFPERPG